jgi:predicted transcriptional regulator
MTKEKRGCFVGFKTSETNKAKIDELADSIDRPVSFIVDLIVNDALKPENDDRLKDLIRQNFKIPSFMLEKPKKKKP